MNSTSENFMDWSRSFVARCVNEDFEDVTSSCTTVEVSVGWINGQAVDESFVLGQLTIHARKLVRLRVHHPELDRVIVSRHEAIADCIEELDILALLLKLGGRGTVSLRPTLIHVPNDKLVSIANPSQRNQIHLVARERKCLNCLIMVSDSV